MKSPITVVIPAYNAASTIERAIRSVLDQNAHLPEVIVVNDGSVDETLSVVEEISATYGGLIRVINQENAGPVLARQTGFRAAQGDYLLSVDADDFLLPGTIDRLEILIRNAAYPDLLLFHGRREGSKRTMSDYKVPENELLSDASRSALLDLFVDTTSINNLVLKLFHRRIFNPKQDYSFAKSFRHGEDALQVLPLLNKARSVFVSSEVFYVYCANPSSVTSVGDIKYLNDSKIFRRELLSSGSTWGLENFDARVSAKLLRSVFSISKRLSKSDALDESVLSRIRHDNDVRECLLSYSQSHLSLRQRIFARLLSTKRYRVILLGFQAENKARQLANIVKL